MIAGLHHVQLAMPRGQEAAAREFYAGVLGMTEVPKPPHLAVRGGVWFSAGSTQVHLGVEEDFRPAKKAHPALRCADYDGLVARLRAAAVDVQDDNSIPEMRRCHISDPFGNRIELIV